MKKYKYILSILLVIFFVRCDESDKPSPYPVVFWSKIYFEDQQINDSIASLERHIDYSLGKWDDPYTNGDTIETKILRTFLYTINYSFDNENEYKDGGLLRFDVDESTGKSYLILRSGMSLYAMDYKGAHDATYKLYCPVIFGDKETHVITIKYQDISQGFNNMHLIPAKECYIDGKPGKILDYDLNIMEFKVFDD